MSCRVCGRAAPNGLCGACAVAEESRAAADRARFVGREHELTILGSALDEAAQGRGRVVLVTGEPGIGKTRLVAEFAVVARRSGALILWGGCYEGEWAPPFGPFAEALTGYVRATDAETLHADLAVGGPALTRLIPALRERLPDLPEPTALQPDEERFRLLDATSQLLIATARRAPVVVIVDDLHWADAGAIAMLRHLARFAPAHRILLLGTYRDSDIDRGHPLVDALAAMRREAGYVPLPLHGLDSGALATVLSDTVDRALPDEVVSAIAAETNGNPFFAREVVRHLAEAEALPATGTTIDLRAAGVPEGVRQVIERRLARLSASANRLLTAAALFPHAVALPIIAAVAEHDETTALDAMDEALAAQLMRPGDMLDTYDFSHALVRHTLYAGVSPSRQVRLHRRAAEVMEQVYGNRVGQHAAEVAEQYRCSAALPGGQAGVVHAIAAADQAYAAVAYDRAAGFLRTALDLQPADDVRGPDLAARRSLALIWAMKFSDATSAAQHAAALLAENDPDAAADFLAVAADAMHLAGSIVDAVALARLGLQYIGPRRNHTWAFLKNIDIRHRDLEGPDAVGLPLDSADRREVVEVLAAIPSWDNVRVGIQQSPGLVASRWSSIAYLAMDNGMFRDRRALLSVRRGGMQEHRPLPRFAELRAGEYRQGLPIWREWAANSERAGQISLAVACWAEVFRFHVALGEFHAARDARAHSAGLASRLMIASPNTAQLIAGEDEWRMARDEDWDQPMLGLGPGMNDAGMRAYYSASTWASIARIHARMGRIEPALRRLERIMPAIERAPGWADNYVRVTFDAAEALWLTRRTEWIETIERNLRDKVIAPDWRYPTTDGRLAVARLCALQGRYDEAREWFAQARTVLDEQEARPLRAIVDYDEALMFARRGDPGDRERATPLLEVALTQFAAVDMPGWIRRARALLTDGCEWTPSTRAADGTPFGATAASVEPPKHGPPPKPRIASGPVMLRREGAYWILASSEATHRLKDAKGLYYLAHLLRHSGQEFHVLDLVQGTDSRARGTGSEKQKPRTGHEEPETRNHGLEVLDPAAKAAYKRRLAELREELEEAEQFNDSGRAERAREEIDAISEQLVTAIGLGGRDRVTGGAAERARSTVTKRIKDAIAKIGASAPALADHLRGRVRTGTFCVYLPDAARPIEWEL